MNICYFSEICGPNEFRCSSLRDECIPIAKVCDLETDCLAGEDEVQCGEYS